MLLGGRGASGRGWRGGREAGPTAGFLGDRRCLADSFSGQCENARGQTGLAMYSLKQLFAAVAFFGLASAALCRANKNWAAVASAVGLLVLLAAIVLAVYGRGGSRAFWVGFAICGWGFVLYAHSNLFDHGATYFTHRFTWFLHERLTGVPSFSVPDGQALPSAPRGTIPDLGAMGQVAKYVFAIVIGWLGGCLAAIVHSRRETSA